MFERHILQTIAQRLTAQGDCLYDPHCIYAAPGKCVAPPDVLEEKLTKIENALMEKGRGMVMRGALKPSPWPCNDITWIVFVSKNSFKDHRQKE